MVSKHPRPTLLHRQTPRGVDGHVRPQAGRAPMTPAYVFSVVAIAAIWLSVIVATIFSPDMITGAQHDHLVVAWGDWLWAAIATGLVAIAALTGIRAKVASHVSWAVLGLGVSGIWLAVVLVSIFARPFITGTDPTVLPFGVMLSPIAGLVATSFACAFVESTFSSAPDGSTAELGDTTDTVTKLQQLATLHGSGVITDAEFEQKKADLLSHL
jgi:hypothetical protein